jgi:hypothetical protein
MWRNLPYASNFSADGFSVEVLSPLHHIPLHDVELAHSAYSLTWSRCLVRSKISHRGSCCGRLAGKGRSNVLIGNDWFHVISRISLFWTLRSPICGQDESQSDIPRTQGGSRKPYKLPGWLAGRTSGLTCSLTAVAFAGTCCLMVMTSGCGTSVAVPIAATSVQVTPGAVNFGDVGVGPCLSRATHHQ